MSFHLQPGELNPEAPEVWGVPRLSTYAATWLVDWFDASGDKIGATVPDAEQFRFISRETLIVEKMATDCDAWLKSIGKTPPIRKRL